MTTAAPADLHVDVDAAVEFLIALFGAAEDTYISKKEGDYLWFSLWELSSKASSWFKVRDLTTEEGLARLRAAILRIGISNTYVNMRLYKENLGVGRRGTAEESDGIVGLWMDLDIASDAHAKSNLPASMDDVRKLLQEAGLPPTYLINTGHGAQAFWLLRAAWIYENDEERNQAANLVLGWHRHVRNIAALHNWTVDSVFDLSRVMRLPGTINIKYIAKTGVTLPAVPVVILDRDDIRYDESEDFDPFLWHDEPAPADGERSTGPRPAGAARRPSGNRRQWPQEGVGGGIMVQDDAAPPRKTSSTSCTTWAVPAATASSRPGTASAPISPPATTAPAPTICRWLH